MNAQQAQAYTEFAAMLRSEAARHWWPPMPRDVDVQDLHGLADILMTYAKHRTPNVKAEQVAVQALDMASRFRLTAKWN